jgi:prolyl-tRNA editing enzyme YbaK/EbsC (Cys-tRNA(Pro) deacylase)
MSAQPPVDLPASALRVQQALRERGHPGEIVIFAQTTRTAQDAAAAIGCDVAQIAKSLVFRTEPGDRAVLVIASGANRVDPVRLAAALGEDVGKADADLVRLRTGFVIGGVPPLAHAEPLITFIDEDLLILPEIWAAAGTPNAVFRLTPAELVQLTMGRVIAVR